MISSGLLLPAVEVFSQILHLIVAAAAVKMLLGHSADLVFTAGFFDVLKTLFMAAIVVLNPIQVHHPHTFSI